MISYIIIAVIFFFLGAEIWFRLFYSPKAEIRQLWKQIYKISEKISEDTKKNPPFEKDWVHILKPEVEKRKKLINALLECYFDPQNESDTEFIRLNKP